MKRPAEELVRPSKSAVAVLAIATIISLLVHCSAATTPQTGGTEPRQQRLKPRLTYRPSDIEACVTSVVTLECSTRSRHTLEERVASSPEKATEVTAVEEDKDVSELDRNIIAIRVLKKETNVNGNEEWGVFAELGTRDPQSPTGSALALSGVGISGSVGGPATNSYLQVIWDLARNETFGVYRCDVLVLATRDGESPGGMETLRTEPVRLIDRKETDGDGDWEDETGDTKTMHHDGKAEREEDLKWRKSIEDRLEAMSKNVGRLLHFARGNAFKLNKILSQMAARLTTESSKLTRPTTTSTPKPNGFTRSPTRRTTNSQTRTTPNTRKYVIFRGSDSGGSTRPTPTRNRSYTTPTTTRRSRSYTTPTTTRRSRSYTTPTTTRRSRRYTTPTTRRSRSYTRPTTRRSRRYTTPTTRGNGGF